MSPSSAYDPFSRGPHPVGVSTLTLRDDSRERSLEVELWAPAEPGYRGRDLDPEHQDRYRVMAFAPEVAQEAVRDARPAAGPHPLIVFSHGWGGHRRQTSHLCTHWASHGYVVAAVDHAGNTILDMIAMVGEMKQRAGEESPDEVIGRFMEDRPRDLGFLIDRLLAGGAADRGLPAEALDPDAVGAAGHSFGGWTTLQLSGRDPRVRAALPLAPAGGETPLMNRGPNPLAEGLALEGGRDVPTLLLVAEHDTLLPLDGMRGLRRRVPGEPRLVVLRDADHMHFCDRVEETHELFRKMGALLSGGLEGGPDFSALGSAIRPIDDLVPGEVAERFLRGPGLAHMDAHLRGLDGARRFLEGDLAGRLSARGIPCLEPHETAP